MGDGGRGDAMGWDFVKRANVRTCEQKKNVHPPVAPVGTVVRAEKKLKECFLASFKKETSKKWLEFSVLIS